MGANVSRAGSNIRLKIFSVSLGTSSIFRCLGGLIKVKSSGYYLLLVLLYLQMEEERQMQKYGERQ